MSVTEKYQAAIDALQTVGSDVIIDEQDGRLLLRGTVPSGAERDRIQQLVEEASGGANEEVQLELEAWDEGYDEYTLKSGDTLTLIASRHEGLTWRDIWNANKDTVHNPDSIPIGQVLRIPRKPHH